jgi:hypothetical protein
VKNLTLIDFMFTLENKLHLVLNRLYPRYHQTEDNLNQQSSDAAASRLIATEQLREALVAIEVSTYAQLVREGRLLQKLSPILPKILATNQRD